MKNFIFASGKVDCLNIDSTERRYMVCTPARPYRKTSVSRKAIHHIDGNPYNNDPANLVIVDVEENVR